MGVPDWSSILQLGADYGLISSFSQLEVLGFQVSGQETEGLVSIAGDPGNMRLPWKIMGNVCSEVPGTRDHLQCLVVQCVGCGEGWSWSSHTYYLVLPWVKFHIPVHLTALQDVKSSWSCRESARLLMVKYAAVSSAKSLTWLLTFSGRSFMYATRRGLVRGLTLEEHLMLLALPQSNPLKDNSLWPPIKEWLDPSQGFASDTITM